MVSGNTTGQNGGSGIVLSSAGNAVIGNSVRLNQQHGIEVVGVGGPGTGHLLQSNVVVFNNQSGGAFANIDACGSCTLVDNHVAP